MQIRIPWGPDSLALELPDTWTVVTARADDSNDAPAGNESQIVTRALEAPLDAAPLADRRLAGKRVLIITDDNTRPTPVARFFRLVLNALGQAGVHPEDILVMPALGIHTAMTADEMADKIGPDNLGRVKWRNHDGFDRDQMHAFGRTRRGTPVVLNRLWPRPT